MGDLGKLIVRQGFKKLPKVKKIAKSGQTASLWHVQIKWQSENILNSFFARQPRPVYLTERKHSHGFQSFFPWVQYHTENLIRDRDRNWDTNNQESFLAR